MPAGKGFSGKSGSAFSGTVDATAATKICEVTKWTLDPTAAISKYHSNCTAGHKRAVTGVRDTKGTIEIKVDGEAGAGYAPGQELSLKLALDDTGNNYFAIKHAVISGAPLEVDIDDGAVVGITYAFEASDLTGHGLVANYGTAGVAS